MELILTPHGTAELLDDDEDQLWSSDNDPGFEEEFPDMDFIRDEDAEDVLDYLVECGYISEEAAEDMQIKIEALDDGGDGEEDDDDYVKELTRN